MKKQDEMEELKSLIKNGYDLELISFELEIPIKKLEEIKLQIEKEEEFAQKQKHDTNNENKKKFLRIDLMRKKYYQLMDNMNIIRVKHEKLLSEEEIQLINNTILEIEKKIEEMKSASETQKSKMANSILSSLKKIQGIQLNIEQAEKIIFLLLSEELKHIKLSSTDKIDLYIDEARTKVAINLARAINIAKNQTNDIDELRELSKRIDINILSNVPIELEEAKKAITSKIMKIQQQQAIDKMRNDIPESIGLIISDLADGRLNIETANSVIEAEANKRVETKPKSRFSLTEEQEKRQIIIQITTAIREKAKQYPIKNAEITLLQIQQLCDGDFNKAIFTVVENLIEREDFKTAEGICDKYEHTEKADISYMTTLKKRIRNAEFSNYIIKEMNTIVTEGEEKIFFDTIEKGMKARNINLSSIQLCRSANRKNITLADIWPEGGSQEK